MHSTQQAVAAATDAVRLWEELGDDGNVATGLVTLARQQWFTDQPVAARESAERALRLVEPEGDTERHALARLNLGAVLVLTDREDEGLPVLAAALAVADRAGALEPAALCHNYIGAGRLQLGDLSGAADLLRSVQLARNMDHHEYVMRGYRNLIEGLWRLGRYDEAIAYIDEADAYGRDLDFPGIAYCFEARRCRLPAMPGCWPRRRPGSAHYWQAAPTRARWPARRCRSWPGCWSGAALRRRPRCSLSPVVTPNGATTSSGSPPPASPTSSTRGLPADLRTRALGGPAPRPHRTAGHRAAAR